LQTDTSTDILIIKVA